MALHRTKHEYITSLVHALHKRRGWVRSWHVRGLLVGSWKSRNGKVYAVGHAAGGEVVIYNPRVCVPQHGWGEQS